jgi:hypothetical protein
LEAELKMFSPRLRQGALALASFLLACASVETAGGFGNDEIDARADDPRALLQAAFDNQYKVDTTATIELVIRNGSGKLRRRNFESASKIVGDRLHSIGRLTYPEHLRGMTILQIESDDRNHDAFVYLPSMQSVRRVSTAQRGDAFFGTDVTYEDLERRYAEDYEIVDFAEEGTLGEPAFVVRARPRHAQSYHEVRFWIACSDSAILQVHFMKRGANEPYRTVSAPRSSMKQMAGHTLPTRLVVENRARGTTTEVHYQELVVNPEIDERTFSIRTLEQKRRIPGGR